MFLLQFCKINWKPSYSTQKHSTFQNWHVPIKKMYVCNFNLRSFKPTGNAASDEVSPLMGSYMVPEVVGTIGMSSASVGIDQGIWNWGASSRITMFLRHFISTKRSNKHSEMLKKAGEKEKPVPEDLGAVVVIFHRVLDEAETVHVTNVGVSVGSEQVEAAHRLLRWKNKSKH